MSEVAGHNAELVAERERLTERFVLMQTELGGLFYEMAIRDHLELELLLVRAAELQRLESELREIDQRLGRHGVAGPAGVVGPAAAAGPAPAAEPAAAARD